MKNLAVVCSLATLASSVFAQTATRSFGSVVFPGGATSPSAGITRTFGSAVFPGSAPVPVVRGGASPIVGARPTFPGVINTIPAQVNRNGQAFRHNNTPNGGRNTRNQTYVYAYPVYVGGGYDSGYANGYAPQEQGPPPLAGPPSNMTMVYPPNQRANPVMIQAGPDGEYYTSGGQRQGATVYDSPRAQQQATVDDTPEPAEVTRYLIAFKDHTIYSAVAYWADGDTLHYFTSGNTHNQVSVSLIDRDLTERLNKEMGTDFKLPSPAK
uniref:DUF4476 domain-containing protein n=1 Tax=Solibacter usitatus (strain Ellin6076) TaxID=234267 RepID=Q01SH8_SOLUE